MTNFTTTIILLFSTHLNAQVVKDTLISLSDQIYQSTTIVQVKYKSSTKKDSSVFGTAFFYSQQPDSTTKLSHEKIWLVSNRHVLFPEESYPDTVWFHARKKTNNTIVWVPIAISKKHIKDNCRYFSEKSIDIAVIDISNINIDSEDLLPFFTVHEGNFASSKRNALKPQVGESVIVIGYPLGFYDEYNKYPIVKSGIIASGYGLFYRGSPSFIIDCQLFPGSSGSLVALQPKEIYMVKGEPMLMTDQSLVFLGILSGEPYRKDPNTGKTLTVNISQIWYSELIKDLVK